MSASLASTRASIRNLLMTGFDAFDLLNIGFIVTNVSGRLLLANQTAEKILEAKDGLELTSDGVLSTLAQCGPRSMEPLLAGTLGTNQTLMTVQRPSGKRPLTLLVRSARGMASPSGSAAPVTLFILDPQCPVNPELELRQLYGLTSAETRLANLLMEGKTLDDCCDLLGIRLTTARMHLRNVFTKTGVQRQGELVALLFNSIGSVRVARELAFRLETLGLQRNSRC
jgi:DNA-binding CsgD family transcriptional regulator